MHDMVYALAIGSNTRPHASVKQCLSLLASLGSMQISKQYPFPAKNGLGPDYINLAVILRSTHTLLEIQAQCKGIECVMGRVWGEMQVIIDIDLIAYGPSLLAMQIISKRLPLEAYVRTPLSEIWPQLDVCLQQG